MKSRESRLCCGPHGFRCGHPLAALRVAMICSKTRGDQVAHAFWVLEIGFEVHR